MNPDPGSSDPDIPALDPPHTIDHGAGENPRVGGVAGGDNDTGLDHVGIVDRAMIAQLEADGIIAQSTIANLHIALESARRIGAAIGFVMNAQKVTEEQAFQILREASQHRNRKLRDVAEDVLTIGTMG